MGMAAAEIHAKMVVFIIISSFLMSSCSSSLLPLFTSPRLGTMMSLCWSVVGMPPSWTVPCPQGPSVPSPSRLPGTPSCKYMTKLIKLHSSIKSKQYRTIWYLSNNCIRIVSDYLSYKFYDQVCPAKDITESKLAKKSLCSVHNPLFLQMVGHNILAYNF